MSRRNREKREQKRSSDRAYSTLEQHTKQGGTLVPPMMTVPNVTPVSWHNDRLPEILWAAIVVSHLPRELALSLFRRVAAFGRSLRVDGPPKPGDITHSGLAALTLQESRDVIELICESDAARYFLASLLLLNDLPCREIWLEFLSDNAEKADWRILARAVAFTLDHQSQEATDCRWLKLVFLGLKGQMHFPSSMPDRAEELLNYPDVGDMRAVRPTIRAMEGAISFSEGKSTWPAKFWNQCFTDTPCERFQSGNFSPHYKAGTTSSTVYAAVVTHANHTRVTTGVDPRHDLVFGTALFVLSMLRELLGVGIGQTIIGRTALRTIFECYATLAYLAQKDTPELWQSYRIYGAGQAKLAYLKLSDSDAKPGYVSTQTLESLANEDMWQEFLKIDLRHWLNSNLRSLSESAGVKGEYDRFYPWTSAYTHGHWAAIRDSVFETCGNPLHRLHRIPRNAARTLEDVVADACELVDRTLSLVDKLYPNLSSRVSIVGVEMN